MSRLLLIINSAYFAYHTSEIGQLTLKTLDADAVRAVRAPSSGPR